MPIHRKSLKKGARFLHFYHRCWLSNSSIFRGWLRAFQHGRWDAARRTSSGIPHKMMAYRMDMRIRLKQVITWLGLLLALIGWLCFPASAAPPEKPSAALLIGSWQNLDSALKNEIHSYRMCGRYRSILFLKVNGKGPNKRTADWISVCDGARFRYRNVDPLGESELSYDGKQWNTLNKNPNHRPQGLVLFNPGALYEWPLVPEYQLTCNYPLNLSGFLVDPTNLHREIPLADQYAAMIRHLEVSGPEVVNGRMCYRLHLPIKYANAPKNPFQFVPTDVWMAIDNGHFVPWQFRTDYSTPSAPGACNTASFLAGRWFRDAWFPTRFEDVAALPSKKDANQLLPIYKADGTIKVSRINAHFENSDFRLTFPPGTQVSIQDGNKAGFSKIYRVPMPKRLTGLYFAIASVLIIILAVSRFIIVNRKRRRIRQASVVKIK